MNATISTSVSSGFAKAGEDINEYLKELHSENNISEKVTYDNFSQLVLEKVESFDGLTDVKTAALLVMHDLGIKKLHFKEYKYKRVPVQGEEILKLPAGSKCLQIRRPMRYGKGKQPDISFVEWLEPVEA